ncbi:hypothetical protein HBB16_06525 [Pseudonocardia sp. MCCB 268]|nr:hypothetical protein [Pseudonocardia cytotoxica]
MLDPRRGPRSARWVDHRRAVIVAEQLGVDVVLVAATGHRHRRLRPRRAGVAASTYGMGSAANDAAIPGAPPDPASSAAALLEADEAFDLS